MEKPFAPACERNKDPILKQLSRLLKDTRHLLEVSSGTGQHGVHFAQTLAHLKWQPSDLENQLEGMKLWHSEAGLKNLLEPVELDVNDPQPWLELAEQEFDSVFTANSLHIFSEEEVIQFFARMVDLGPSLQRLAIYGPFKYDGEFTTPSNQEFDGWLKGRDPRSGVRDIEFICELAAELGMVLLEDISMPANNQLLSFIR